MTEVISKELQYQPVVSNHSTTVFRKVSPQGVATGLTLSSSAAYGPVEFILPPSCMNLSKSRLNFQLELPDPGATVRANWVDANALSLISRIVLYDSATGNLWCDVSNVNLYGAMTVPSGTKYDDFKTKGGLGTQGTNSQTMPILAADSQPVRTEDICKSNSLVNVTHANVAMAGTSGVNSYEGRKYLFLGRDSEKSFVDYSIPFSAFKFTALATDKQIYCPSNLILQVYFAPTNNFAWYSTSITDPTSGTAAAVASGTINSVSVQLANEGNLAIVSQVIDRVMKEGLSIPIPYPTLTRQSIASSTNHSYQLTLSKAYGSRILAIISAPFSEGQTAINYTNSHVRGTLSNYNTFINNVAVKYANGYNCLLSEDYYYGNQDYLTGSAVQNIGEYIYAEWIHVDSFFGEKPIASMDGTEIDGLDVGSSTASWSIAATYGGAVAATWATAVIGQKMLTLTNQGSMVA